MEPSPLLSSTSLSCLSFPPFPISPSQEGGHSFGRYNTRIPCCASHSMFQSFFFRAKLNHIQGEDGVYYVSYKMSSLPISDTCQFEQKRSYFFVFFSLSQREKRSKSGKFCFLRKYRRNYGKVEHPLHTLSTFFPRSLGGQARKV